jgi:hypothetical protein
MVVLMTKVIYVLICLTGWTQVDNVVVTLLSPPSTGWVELDDDEFIHLKPDQARGFSSFWLNPARNPANSTSGAFSLDGISGITPLALSLFTPCAPAPLYVFMSMQC